MVGRAGGSFTGAAARWSRCGLRCPPALVHHSPGPDAQCPFENCLGLGVAFDARADGRRICPISAPSGTGQQCGCAPASLPGMGLDGCAVAKSRCDWPLRTSIRNGAVFCWKIFGWIGGPRKASDGGSAVPLRAQYSPCARRRAGRGGLAGGPLGSTHRYAAAKLNRSPASSSSSMTTWAYRLVVLMLMYPAGSLTSAPRPAPGQGDALLTHQDRTTGSRTARIGNHLPSPPGS